MESAELISLTEHTITDRAILEDELSTIQESGIGFNRQELIYGLNAVSAPVENKEGNDVVGALATDGPTNRLKGQRFEEELPDLLLAAANKPKLNIAFFWIFTAGLDLPPASSL